MFSAFIGHGPLYKSKRKNVGKLFTPVVTVAFVLLVAILLVCILAPVVAPYDPNAQDLTQVLAKPTGWAVTRRAVTSFPVLFTADGRRWSAL